LVAYATEQGSTEEIADFVAAELQMGGRTVDVRSVTEPIDLCLYDAVVLGSAVHDRALLPAAELFAWKESEVLRSKQVWLFSVGVGPALRGPIGAILRHAVPKRINQVGRLVEARDYRAFAGVLRDGTSRIIRLLLTIVGGRFGDLRDWSAIEAWTADVADALPGSPRSRPDHRRRAVAPGDESTVDGSVAGAGTG